VESGLIVPRPVTSLPTGPAIGWTKLEALKTGQDPKVEARAVRVFLLDLLAANQLNASSLRVVPSPSPSPSAASGP
jgi:hypothetical protein